MAYVANGKEVLDEGRHMADCRNEADAARIVEALTIADQLGEWRPVQITNAAGEEWPIPYHDEQSEFDIVDDIPVSVDMINREITHNVRQESDEWACSCGVRWDVSEGDNHP